MRVSLSNINNKATRRIALVVLSPVLLPLYAVVYGIVGLSDGIIEFFEQAYNTWKQA